LLLEQLLGRWCGLKSLLFGRLVHFDIRIDLLCVLDYTDGLLLRIVELDLLSVDLFQELFQIDLFA